MDRRELARRIQEVSYLSGTFKLRSGQTSWFYWDKYRFESDPELLAEVVAGLEGLLPAEPFDYLAGLELGGIPLATALSLRTGKRCLFVRKKPKEYGTCNLVEGGFEPDRRAVVIEDVITTAGQVCQSIEQMRKLGLCIDTALCVIDRQQGGQQRLESIGCTLKSLFRLSELSV